MNYEIPSIWIWISGIFFLFGIVAFGATTVVLYKVMQIAEELKPKIESLTERVEALATKLDKLADNVEETVTTVKHSVNGVGGRAQGILGGVEAITKVVSGRLDWIAPIGAAGMSIYRIIMQMRAQKEQGKAKQAKALPGKR